MPDKRKYSQEIFMLDEDNVDLVEQTEDGNENDESVSELENDEETSDSDTQPSEDSVDDNTEDNQEKNYDAVDWVKKRLAQKDRQTKKRLMEQKKEIDFLKQQVSSIYQPVQQEYAVPQGQIVDPTTGDYVDEDSFEGKFVKKFQQIKEAEFSRAEALAADTKKKALGTEIEDLKDKYDDLEDVMRESYKNFTTPMSAMMLNNPQSVELFYNLAKNDPSQLEKISKMSEYQQIKAINFLEFQKANTVEQKLKSNAPKPVTPVKQSTTGFVSKDSYESILKRQREKGRGQVRR